MDKFYPLLTKSFYLKTATSVLLLFIFSNAYSQNVGINSSGSAPHASAGLDVSFSDKGLLIPNVALTSTADVSTIPSPATSLLVYNTANVSDVTAGYYYYSGTAWVRLATGSGGGSSQWTTNGSAIYYNTGNVGVGVTSPTYKLQIGATSNPLFMSGVQAGSTSDSILTIASGVVKKLPQNGLLSTDWSLTGNSGNTTNYLGTTTNNGIRFRTNGTQRFYIDSVGSIGMGSNPTFNATARERFLLDLGTLNNSTGYNAMVVKGTINNYMQFNIQNKSAGTSASTDIIASADNGTESNNYVDLGINGSGNTNDVFGGKNDSYLYCRGGDFLMGTASASKNIQFLTGGTSESSNERMRITSSGTVAIATNNPNTSYKLHVNGDALATSWATTSDRRLKTNIKPLNYGLKTILNLKPVTYNWVDPSQTTQTQLGLIAQDTKKEIPEIVIGDETKEHLSINYTELIPVLIKAIKEQQAKIDAQQKEIDELKSLIKK